MSELLDILPPPPAVGTPYAAVEAFRRERLRLVSEGAFSPGMSSGSLFFCHVLPLHGLDQTLRMRDAGELLDAALWPPGGYGMESRFNADGYLVYSCDSGDGIDAHVQWFRFGGVEACGARLVQPDGIGRGPSVQAIGGQMLAHFFSHALPSAVEVLRSSFSLHAPLAVSAALVGMRGVAITDVNGFRPRGHVVDRDLVLTPWVTLAPGEDPVCASDVVADCIWQSAGHSRMPHDASW